MDERPPVWVGHLVLTARDVAQTAAFWDAIGLRTVAREEQITIFELRGGTHLLLFPGEPPGPHDGTFDLMVDDLDATHAAWSAKGLTVSEITEGEIHNGFTVTDPDGREFTVSNSHVMGVV